MRAIVLGISEQILVNVMDYYESNSKIKCKNLKVNAVKILPSKEATRNDE